MVRSRSDSARRLGVESLERRDCPTAVPTASVAISSGAAATIVERAGRADATFLTVTLSAPATRAVQVGYIITGDGITTGVAPADYQLSIGARGLGGPSGTIEFARGETVKQVRVAAVDDRLREGTESLRFKLFRPVGCAVDQSQSQVDLAVRDNDDYQATIETAPGSDSFVAEGAAAAFVIQLDKPATKAETFYVSTRDGTATARDYRPLRDMPVTILAGQSRSVPFRVSSVADGVEETDEFFMVMARPLAKDMPTIEPMGVTVLGTGPGLLDVTVSNPTVTEGNSGFTACTFTLTLSTPSSETVEVQYTTIDGTAEAGLDYVAQTGSIVFKRGQMSKTVTVNVIGDTLVESSNPPESFSLGFSADVYGISLTAAGTASIEDDDSAFVIIVTFPDSSLTPVQQQVFRRAASRWSQIIMGDLPDVTFSGRVIDDIEISATAPRLDGAGGILGQATWTNLRSASDGGLPYTGFMEFDSADVGQMIQNGTFENVVLHEMGHVLGIGTLWAQRGLLTGAGTADPQYTGASALAEYRTLLGNSTVTGVPVENDGGPGTRDAHWRESVFRTELMTGYAERPGVPMPISRLTVASLQDVGYAIRLSAADPYALPTSVSALSSGARASVAAAKIWLALDQQRVKPVLRAAAFSSMG